MQYVLCGRGHNHPLWCVAASTLGVYIATGSHDCTARLWNLERTFPVRMFAGHCHDVNVSLVSSYYFQIWNPKIILVYFCLSGKTVDE